MHHEKVIGGKMKNSQRKYDLYLLLIIMLIACTSKNSSPLDHFNRKTTEFIHPARIIDLEEFGVLRPFNLIRIDNDNFVIQDNKTKIYLILSTYRQKKLLAE